MALVEIYVDQQKIDQRLAEIESKVTPLQAIYDELKEIGVTAPTLADIKSLQGNHVTEATLKTLVLRDKNLTVGGFQIGAEAVRLNPTLVSSLIARLKALSDVEYPFYVISEILEDEEPTGEYEVTTVADLADLIKPEATIMGTELAGEVVEDVMDLAVGINAILAKIKPGVHSPMRSPEHWLKYNIDTQTFSVDFAAIAYFVK